MSCVGNDGVFGQWHVIPGRTTPEQNEIFQLRISQFLICTAAFFIRQNARCLYMESMNGNGQFAFLFTPA